MRKIPAALKEHLQQPVTTTTRLLKIILRDGRTFGLTSLDRDVEYQGTTYVAMNGFDPSVIASDASFGIDNSEGHALLSADIPGITVDMVVRGELDDAEWACYLVNYEDLSQGHLILDAGDLGDVRVVRDTVYIPELVSYAMRLRQSIGHVDSRTCRADFGSDPMGQRGCGVDAEALWESGSVSGPGADPFYQAAGVTSSTTVVPGRFQWLTGDNASDKLYAVESLSGGVVTLFERLPFPIQAGDQYRIRPDCDKRFTTCRNRWGNMINFKGEPHIPVSDGSAAQTPGATV